MHKPRLLCHVVMLVKETKFTDGNPVPQEED